MTEDPVFVYWSGEDGRCCSNLAIKVPAYVRSILDNGWDEDAMEQIIISRMGSHIDPVFLTKSFQQVNTIW